MKCNTKDNMKDKLIFYRCESCGNLILMLEDAGVTPICCGEPMTQLSAAMEDGDAEKHVPVCRFSDDTVTVSIGSKPHPMEESHHILWICLQTTCGIHLCHLCAKDKPEATFRLSDGERPLRAYAYCNIHGLWVADR